MAGKNKTGIALIAPQDAQYSPGTSQFGEDGLGYIKMMTHPNRYITEAGGEEYTSVEPDKNYIGSATAPQTTQDGLNYASGDVQPLADAAIDEQRQSFVPIEALGAINAPIIRMGITPGLDGVAVDDTSNWDRMSAKDRRKTNRELNREERDLRRDIRRDLRTEQAIAKKYGSEYDPGNRTAMDEQFTQRRERLDLMRRLLNE